MMKENKRQIIFRFIRYKTPDGTKQGTIGRSTMSILKKDLHDPQLWEQLEDWALKKRNVEIGKATRVVTVNVFVTDTLEPEEDSVSLTFPVHPRKGNNVVDVNF